MAQFGIEITNFNGGFAPAWYKETYPSYGNKNTAGAMLNCDISNPGYMCQGAGLATLTAGEQTGAVTTLIKGMTDYAVQNGVAFGVGGNRLYKFSNTAVENAGIWSHTIDKGTVTDELGEDVCYYNGTLYYSYNHSGSAGDIGTYNLDSTFDDDWGSTVPSGAAALQSAPHQMLVGGNDRMYIANGRYVATWDGTTLIPQALDIPSNMTIQSIVWSNDKIYISANDNTITGTNKGRGSVYIWDGTTDSWEFEIRLMGKVGALYEKNGTVFVWYQDITSTGGFKLGYINNGGITDLANYTGNLPAFYQVTDWKDFIIWASDDDIFAFGSGDRELQVKLFQLASAGYTTAGGIACPFGTPIVASNQTTSFKLAKFDGFTTTSYWKSLMFDITGGGRVSKINLIRVNFEKLESGARVDLKLLNNLGGTIFSDTISYDKLGATTSVYLPLNGLVTENFRVELDYTNGSTSKTVAVKSIKIYGEYN